MNLKIIQENIDKFKKELKQQQLCDIDWLYEKQLLLCHYNILTVNNLDDWLSILFSSSRTQRFWQREAIRSAELLCAMAQYNPDMICTAFRDLFDEQRDLEGRVDRFKFYMDELIAGMRRNSRDFLESWHHQDNAIISYYLMMQYPELYCYYERQLHVDSIQILGAQPLDQGEDFPRFQKMTKTLSIFILKDEELIDYHLKRFQTGILKDNKLIIYEYLLFINNRRART